MVDIPGDSTTTTTIAVGGTLNDSLEVVGDRDWIRVELTAGQQIVITLNGAGATPLDDPYLRLLNSSGTLIAENDDSGGGLNSRIVFTVQVSGTYYIDVGAYADSSSGTYQLSVQPYTPPPVYTNDQIASQLTHGYWGGDYRHFDVSPGGSITVNLTALTPDGQALARAALMQWSGIIGVTFVEVASGGQISFDDNDDGAYASAVWSNHVISSAHINVSSQWLTNYGTSLNSYSFQVYLHEIGHALGLGHAGNYNGEATYPDDALFANDSWATTAMSYFSQTENGYFANQGFTQNFLVTPMAADILAMQTLYGLSTTTRTGNDTYGVGNTTGNPVYGQAYAANSFTIFDNGGIDTLDYSAFSSRQTINLNPETFSSVGGSVGNMTIARGTVIENAIGGSGHDTLIGNSADNVLMGNGGNDTLDGGAGNDTASYANSFGAITIDLAITGGQATGAAGFDTLISIENVIGGSGNDTIRGTNGANILEGRNGNDTLDGRGGNDILIGGAGDDTLIGRDGDDTLDGGAGYDKMYGGIGNDTYIVSDSTDYAYEYAGEGNDTVRASITHTLRDNIENLVLTGSANIAGAGNGLDNVVTGNGGANRLYGHGGNDTIYGMGGNDVLYGGAGNDTMHGGTGNDFYSVTEAGDVVVELAGQGTDTIYASVSYTIAANVERLYLVGNAAIDATGGSGNDILVGNEANNVLTGGGGNDRLYGNGGNDTLIGGGGIDKLFGGTGNDTYIIDDSSDHAYEAAGAGTDHVIASVSYTLRDHVENLTLTGASAINGYGNDGANIITGNNAANTIAGRGGNDTIFGNGGNDFLYGEDGSDIIVGGAGIDRMWGGSGSDTFVFNDGDFGGATTATADVIHDFLRSDGDLIDLSAVDANSTLGGDQAFTFIGSAAFSNVAGQLRYEQIGAHTYVSGDTDGDGVADFMIRVDGLHTFVSGDFLI